MPVVRKTAFVLVVLVLFSTTPSLFAAKTFGDKIKDAAASSAGGKGAEFAIKLVGGMIYNTACPPKTPNEKEAQFLCDVLGSVTGRTDEEWQKKVDAQLTKMSTQLDQLDKNLSRIESQNQKRHEALEREFQQVSVNVAATKVIVRVDNLWNRYKMQLESAGALNRDTMLAFASEVIAEKLHTKLGDLNVVLTQPTIDSQPLLRYPFVKWRKEKGVRFPPETFHADEVYDFTEKKFMYFRSEQQKLYIVYLWAAEILEARCEMEPAKCVRPPVSSKAFAELYEKYTRQQLEAFNASVDWLLLSYSFPHNERPRFLPITDSPERILMRANYLTATVLGASDGLWGRVVSMGNAWDGSLDVQCGGVSQTLTPALRYRVPVEDASGTLDWWVSRNADRVYNEVRFANEWQMYHYSLSKAPAGPCTIRENLPKRAGMLAWIEPGVEVATLEDYSVPENETEPKPRTYNFGSFIAVQRAGGSYALASGDWTRRGEPWKDESGTANQKNPRFDWIIAPQHQGGPWAALHIKGRGEWKFRSGSRVKNWYQIYFHGNKPIYFPDDRKVKLNLNQSIVCELNVCDGQTDVVMEYDIENDDSTAGKGKLTAVAAIFLDPNTTNPNDNNERFWIRDRRNYKNGIVVDGSYNPAGDRRQARIAGNQTGTATVDPGAGYKLQYLLETEVHTEGRGTNATDWWYRARLTPLALYLTR